MTTRVSAVSTAIGAALLSLALPSQASPDVRSQHTQCVPPFQELGSAVPVELVVPELQDVLHMLPGVTLRYARRLGRPVVRAGADDSGNCYLVVAGETPAEVVSLDLRGTIRWRCSLSATLHSTEPWFLFNGANGSVLSVIGVDESTSRYIVLSPVGAIAFDEIIHGEDREVALSPCGRYYYRVWQPGARIHLLSVSGGAARVLDLPAWEGDTEGRETFVRFVKRDRLLLVRFAGRGAPRRAVVNLGEDGPGYVELDPVPVDPALPELAYPSQAGFAKDGEYLQVTGPGGRVSCHDPHGRLLWSNPIEECKPRWVIPAEDRPLAAAVDAHCLAILDVTSGRVLGTGRTKLGSYWIHEASFANGLLLASTHGGDGTQHLTIVVKVSASGSVEDVATYDVMTCGLEGDRPVLGLLPHYKAADSCLVVGVEKQP